MRKLSVLCLHGYSMTGALLQQSMRRTCERLSHLARFRFVDGPHTVEPSPHLPLELPEGTRPLGWWRPERQDDRSWHFHGVDDSLALLSQAEASEVEAHGHGVDVVLGFSQGSALAHLATALRQHRPSASPLPSLCGAVFVGGFPFAPASPAFAEASLHLSMPTLHVAGSRDKIVRPETSARLLQLCAEDNRTYHEHQGGHVVHSGSASLAVYEDWFARQHVGASGQLAQ